MSATGRNSQSVGDRFLVAETLRRDGKPIGRLLLDCTAIDAARTRERPARYACDRRARATRSRSRSAPAPERDTLDRAALPHASTTGRGDVLAEPLQQGRTQPLRLVTITNQQGKELDRGQLRLQNISRKEQPQ